MSADPTSNTEHSVVYCPVFHSVIELIGRRWNGAILKVLFDAPRPYGAIREEIPSLSDRLLTQRLNELSSAGLVEKSPSDRTGVYQLTAMGLDLQPIFDEVEGFAHRWVSSITPA